MFSKKIVAGAALLALAAAAQAQVKVYGYVDLGFGSFESAGNNTKSVTAVESGNLMTSFIGFSGSEDLGGGLKAEFALESFIGADTGGTLGNNVGGFWGRASWIALGGDFGRVIIGQYDTPLFVSGLSYNPFGSSMLLSPTMRHYYGLSRLSPSGVVAGTGRTLTTDTGWVNSLTYETPNLSGFTATAQWSPKETSGTGTKDSFTLGAAYNAGPLSLMGVYADHGANGTNAYLGKQKVWALNASYDFAVVKGFFQYTSVDNADTSVDDTAWQLGATVPVSAMGNVMVSYGELKEDTTANTTTKNKIFSVGYDHSLSKRTGAYVAFTTERATNLDSGNSFLVGVRHAF